MYILDTSDAERTFNVDQCSESGATMVPRINGNESHEVLSTINDLYLAFSSSEVIIFLNL